MRKEYRTYLIGGLIFIALVIITFRLVFKGFSDSGSLYIPELFTLTNLAVLVFLILLFYIFDGLRLYFVFLAIDVKVSFSLMLKLVFINIFASGVTPLATGGGFAQIYFLTRNQLPLGLATAATTIRTVIASIMIFGTVPIILILDKGLSSIIPIKNGFLFSMLLILFYLVLIWVLIRRSENLKKIARACITLLHKLHLVSEKKSISMKEASAQEIDLLGEHLARFKKGKPGYIFLSLLTALIYLILLFSFPYVLLRYMGEQVHIITVLSIQVLITFLIYFTPTPGGSGIAEGGFALIFANFTEPVFVAPLTFYWRFITSYLGMIIGLFVFYSEIWSKDRASKKNL